MTVFTINKLSDQNLWEILLDGQPISITSTEEQAEKTRKGYEKFFREETVTGSQNIRSSEIGTLGDGRMGWIYY